MRIIKNSFILIVILFGMLLLQSCPDIGDGSVKDISLDEVEKGFYRSGSLIYSPDDLQLNMLVPLQYFTIKLGKFSITEETLSENEGNELATESDESLVSDLFTSTEERYYSLYISALSLEQIEMAILEWDGNGFNTGKSVRLTVGESYDLDHDGFDDIEWIAGDEERGISETSCYLNFISSYKNRYTTHYQMREKWAPKGYLPFGIISFSPDGNIFINDEIINESQRAVFDEVISRFASGTYTIDPLVMANIANLSATEQSILKLISFLQTGDLIYKPVIDKAGEIADSLLCIKKIHTTTSRDDSTHLTGESVEEMSLDELEADDDNYQDTLEQGFADTYDYSEDYELESDRSSQDRAYITGKVFSTDTIDLDGMGSIVLEAGIKFKINVSFKKWWIGTNSKLIVRSTPYFTADASISTVSGGSSESERIHLFSGVKIPLGSFPGYVRVGNTYLTPKFEIGSNLDTSISYEYSKTYKSSFRFKAGRKSKRWYGSSKYLGTDKISETSKATIPTFPSNVSSFAFNPSITTEIDLSVMGILKPYVDYTLQSNNEVAFSDSRATFNSSISGYASSGITFGMRKTFRVKVAFVKVKKTIGVSKRFSFGRIKGTTFKYDWLEDYTIDK